MSHDTRESWVQSIAPGGAKGALEPVFQRIHSSSASGHITSLWQACGLDPAGLDALFAHYQALMEDPAPLSHAQAELVALVVSATNGCTYCVAHHGPRLAGALANEPLARAVARDYREANLTARDRVLLDYAVALTCEPAERKLEDVERIREYGFNDAAIVRATGLTAFFNQLNRIVNALGVVLEADVEAWEYGAQK